MHLTHSARVSGLNLRLIVVRFARLLQAFGTNPHAAAVFIFNGLYTNLMCRAVTEAFDESRREKASVLPAPEHIEVFV